MGLNFILLSLLVCYLFFYCKWVEGYQKLSKEENLKLEEELNRLNKPAIKIIKTRDGIIYDCVDFYKQPTFDHPLLKNHSFHPKILSTKGLSSEKNDQKLDFKPINIELDDGGCPVGTVPIRRTTRDDIIRAKIYSDMYASKINPLADSNITRYRHAVFRIVNETVSYEGVGSYLSIWQMEVSSSQYSSGRIKIINDDESIEVGWTVNPILYGDFLPHLYIYTNAGNSHCFNAQCGYVHVRNDVPIDAVLRPSYPGEAVSAIYLYILKDTVSWALFYEDTQIGFWPNEIFNKLGNRVTQVEFGGETYGPTNVKAPGMGSGLPLTLDAFQTAICGKSYTVLKGFKIPLDKLTPIQDEGYAVEYRNRGQYGGEMIYYGGPGGAIG